MDAPNQPIVLPPMAVPVEPEPVYAFVLYDAASGQITMRFSGIMADGEANAAANGKSLLAVDKYIDPDTMYVVDGELVDRPVNTVLLEGRTLRRVPVPSELMITDIGSISIRGNRVSQSYALNEDVVELDFPIPGTYELQLTSFPCRSTTFTITVP